MDNRDVRSIPFYFQLGDWELLSVSLPLQMHIVQLSDDVDPVAEPHPPADAPAGDCQGFGVRNLPVTAELPEISVAGDYLRYVPLQYEHCYIDLGWTFEEYRQKFSSKTRSTIQRKIRKFTNYCGGKLEWRAYRTPAEIPDFFALARTVSTRTYQERMLDIGLPDDDQFLSDSVALAAEDRLRAFILFHGSRPVSYLYCPEEQGVVTYAFLGYDPDYRRWSPGTILQWLAIEQLFEERKFRFFDFTEGTSDHKRLFATHYRLCANVFFVRRSLRNSLLIRSHRLSQTITTGIGNILDRTGLKTKLRNLLRSRQA